MVVVCVSVCVCVGGAFYQVGIEVSVVVLAMFPLMTVTVFGRCLLAFKYVLLSFSI